MKTNADSISEKLSFPEIVRDYSTGEAVQIDSKQKVVFHHIPKTAGSTFRAILENLFPGDEVCPAETVKELEGAFAPGQSNNYRLFAGHFSYSAIEKFLGDAIWLTFLRNPIERVVSHYYNHINMDRIPDTWKKRVEATPNYKKYIEEIAGSSLKEWLTHKNPDANTIACNRQTQAFLPTFIRKDVEDWSVYNADFLDLAKKNLSEKFHFVGIQSDFDKSLDVFSMTFGRHKIGGADNFTTNLNTKKSFSDKYALDDDLLSLVKERNSMDIELFEFATNLFYERYSNFIDYYLRNDRRTRIESQLANTEAGEGNISLTVDSLLSSQGFYSPEKSLVNKFMWSGYETPAVVELNYKFDVKKQYRVSLVFLDAAEEEAFKGLDVFFNEKPVELTRKVGVSKLKASFTVDGTTMQNCGAYHTVRLYSPLFFEREVTPGARQIGLAFHGVKIKEL